MEKQISLGSSENLGPGKPKLDGEDTLCYQIDKRMSMNLNTLKPISWFKFYTKFIFTVQRVKIALKMITVKTVFCIELKELLTEL